MDRASCAYLRTKWSTAIIVFQVMLFTSSSYCLLATTNSTLPVPENGQDFCLHESFNASCRHGSVILITSAAYGRMRLGRCINGDFNIGCSKDVVTYMDAQCTGRLTCEVSVRNLVDIHPCQRDFMSYLEASYKCIEVAGIGLPVCPREARLSVDVTATGGYLSNAVGPYRWYVGTDVCPWRLTARSGQKIYLRAIVLSPETTPPIKTDDTVACSAVYVIKDNYAGTREFPVCSNSAASAVAVGSKARERHLYTSTGNEVTLYVSRGMTKDHRLTMEKEPYPRLLISFEVIGCPDLYVPPNAWLKRMGDNVMIKCNETLETWYFSCQRSQWIGDVGNCSQGIRLMKNDGQKDESAFPMNGIVLAVLIGILLGIFIGMILLLTVHCVRRRSRRRLKKRAAMFIASRSTSDSTRGEATFRRCGSRHRSTTGSGAAEVDRYPALLPHSDKSSTMTMATTMSTSVAGGGNGGDLEKLYDFGVTNSGSSAAAQHYLRSVGGSGGGVAGGPHRYCCASSSPGNTLTDYPPTIDMRNVGSGDICRTYDDQPGLNYIQQPVGGLAPSGSGGAVGGIPTMCPLCVVHDCECREQHQQPCESWMAQLNTQHQQQQQQQSRMQQSTFNDRMLYDRRAPTFVDSPDGPFRRVSGGSGDQLMTMFKVQKQQHQQDQQQHEMTYYPAGLRSPDTTATSTSNSDVVGGDPGCQTDSIMSQLA